MKYLIRAVSGTQTYWLRRVGQTTQYRWKTGPVGRAAACRFDTEAAAKAVIDSGYGGAGGVFAEVVETEE